MWVSLFFILLALSVSLGEPNDQNPCRKKKLSSDADSSYVCVCNSQYCDTTNGPLPTEKNEYVFVTSSRDGGRFNFTVGKFPRRYRVDSVPTPIDLSKTNVKIKNIVSGRQFRGWGGTYTGSSAYVISIMATALQQRVFESFYSPNNGSNLSIMRIPIGYTANDFKRWTYNEYPVNDTALTNFTTFNREDRLRGCQIKQLKQENPNVQFMAVASAAPSWMMQTVNGLYGKQNVLKKEYYQTWADYHLKYLEMMNEQNISFAYISTGQRPDTSIIEGEFRPLSWNVYEHGKWLGKHFGPTLRASHFANISILSFDDNRHKIPLYVSSMNVGNVNASNFIDAIGIQNYKNHLFLPTVLDLTYSTFPTTPIMNTEISFPDATLGSWNNAEALAIDIIQNLQRDSLAYLFNNLILNRTGGPHLNGQQQDAPILVSDDSAEFYKQPSYYILAHFAKYIIPGSVRLDTFTDKSHVYSVSYLRPDDRIATFMYNRLEKPVPVVLSDLYQGTTEFQLEPKSINTLIY